MPRYFTRISAENPQNLTHIGNTVTLNFSFKSVSSWLNFCYIRQLHRPLQKPSTSENPKHTQHAFTTHPPKKQHSAMHTSETKPFNSLPQATKNLSQQPSTALN